MDDKSKKKELPTAQSGRKKRQNGVKLKPLTGAKGLAKEGYLKVKIDVFVPQKEVMTK